MTSFEQFVWWLVWTMIAAWLIDKVGSSVVEIRYFVYVFVCYASYVIGRRIYVDKR